MVGIMESGPQMAGVVDKSPVKKRRARRGASLKNRRVTKKPSAALYVGYVEETETVDMIMKKFEALEQAQAKAAAVKAEKEAAASAAVAEGTGENTDVNVPSISKKGKGRMTQADIAREEEELMLTEEQLEDLFRQTSYTSMGNLLHNDRADVLDTATEFVNSDDELEYFYDSEDEDFVKPRSSRKKGSSGPREKVERRVVIRLVTCQAQDPTTGKMVIYKKRVRIPDPNLPVYTRVPNPVPFSWAHTIKPYSVPTLASLQTHPKEYYHMNILQSKLRATLKESYDAVLFDPPWLTSDTVVTEETKDKYITPAQFAKLDITDKLIPYGFAFIWVEKEDISTILKVFAKWGFDYIENFSVLQKTVNNKFIHRPYRFFAKSKLTLLMLRKGSESMELRHQRNPDIGYDFIRHSGCEQKYKTDFVYKVLETLLPDANFKAESGRGRFLHLWAPHGDYRKGWTKVVDEKTTDMSKTPAVVF